MIIQHEDRVGPWVPFGTYGYSRFRIWQRLTPFGMYQRHEWERDNGERISENWILSGVKGWLPNAMTTDEVIPSETDILLASIRSIAAGHNDPRALAKETLEAIENVS